MDIIVSSYSFLCSTLCAATSTRVQVSDTRMLNKDILPAIQKKKPTKCSTTTSSVSDTFPNVFLVV